ncbi:unnamed protein product, partial [Candidula unifasciata]
MQNTVGKLLEKIVAQRLTTYLELHDKFPPTLGGYRLNKETWFNAAVFAYDVYEGFQIKEETCAAVLDLEDAYNKVPYDYLMQLLLKLEVNPILIRWIAAVLFQRKI